MGRTERFGFCLTSTEKSAIGKLAEIEGGLSKAALMRCLIRYAAIQRGVWDIDGQSIRDNQELKEVNMS